MEKKVFNKTGTRQLINSDFKTFNEQTNLITTGNACCNTQTSFYIRPYKDVINGSYVAKEGDFLKFDLRAFQNVPTEMMKILEDKERDSSYILYKFFITKDGRQDIIGYVLTDYNDKLILTSVNFKHGGNYRKRISAINECLKYIVA